MCIHTRDIEIEVEKKDEEFLKESYEEIHQNNVQKKNHVKESFWLFV
jgi:hypothetical protein